MSLNAANITIKPMRVFFGEDVTQSFTVSCEADVASSLQNAYFFFYIGNTKHHLWYNVGGTGVDPAPSGSTPVVAAIAANDTATTVATVTAAAINALAGISATSSTSIVSAELATAGLVRSPHRGVGLANTEFKVTRYGSTEFEVGFVDEEITMSTEEQSVDVTANQTGGSVIGAFSIGRSMEVGMTLKETSLDQLKRMYLLGGGDSTSGQGAAGTEVFGYGTDKVFQNQFSAARKLRMHPVQLPLGDTSQDVTYFKAYPQIGEEVFKGQDIYQLPVTFRVFPDFTKVGAARYMVIGNGAQTFTL